MPSQRMVDQMIDQLTCKLLEPLNAVHQQEGFAWYSEIHGKDDGNPLSWYVRTTTFDEFGSLNIQDELIKSWAFERRKDFSGLPNTFPPTLVVRVAKELVGLAATSGEKA